MQLILYLNDKAFEIINLGIPVSVLKENNMFEKLFLSNMMLQIMNLKNLMIISMKLMITMHQSWLGMHKEVPKWQ